MTAIVESMDDALKTLTYKGRVVFQKVRVAGFKRLPKAYHGNEACFVFVMCGEFAVRAQTQELELNRDTALLAKCLNYFYEPTRAQQGVARRWRSRACCSLRNWSGTCSTWTLPGPNIA